ncbi:MAG: mevalonate kinase [Bacteroidota bacterium]
MIIRAKSYPRAALIGNPSDGYFGKTIAFVFSNFSAEVVLYQSPELEIMPAEYDKTMFYGIKELVADVKLYGYYGGIRLLKAAVKAFYEYCERNKIQLVERNFTIRYKSDIPYRLGLAGSSAIITACMKALMSFFSIDIPAPILANLVLSVEQDELKISAGLQDRVAQAYECPVYMDFDEKLMQKQGYGYYERLNADNLQNIYIAYRRDLSEGSEVVHNNFRERFNYREPDVLTAIEKWKKLTGNVKDRIQSGNPDINGFINENFDIRKAVMTISSLNLKMVELARSVGASAKFTGSGGAIIGLYKDENNYTALKKLLNENDIEVLKPVIVCN